MILEFGIGKETQKVDIKDELVLDVLTASEYEAKEDEETLVRKALEEPVASPALAEIVRPGQKIVIVSSDITRPMPTRKVMPALLDELYRAGASPKDITLMLALGSHRPHTEEERRHLAGERAFSEISVVDSNPDDTVHLGTTKAGTPCDFDRRAVEADVRIALGNVEYHYFAGYSGGAKAMMPGVSTRSAIQMNHRMMVRDEACAGRLEGNPIREDIEEAAAMLGVDFILNVVLDSHKNIIYAAAGDVTKAHRKACAFLDTIYRKPIKQRADIVIVSQGGAPKDLNLYQTQKALDNAKHAVRDGGIVILVGACQEGLGEKTFEQWMLEAEKPHDLIDRVRENFKLGGHKAAAIAMVLERAGIFLVSKLDDDFVKSIFMEPYHSVQEAYDAAKARLGEDSTVIAMPYGGSTLPIVAG
ncbi:MAG: nickel-dependent lactate racemase [Firmicutes bacterium]|nr:nickel-dependent lactate racemase [Bacillota bacterium]